MADPFQPKFVDLVRNFTTTTGTGNFVPGAAVSGFRSLSGAVAPGDVFYYCVMGIDKPAEREVGRGTMMANGSVARQPIGGAATNFTTGNKTLSLVAAAEWFSRSAPWATPQMYGAKADGIADDAIALQAWLDRGGELRLPAGHYFSSQRLLVRRQVVIKGDGWSFDARESSLAAMSGSRIRFAAGAGGMLSQMQTTESNTNAAVAAGLAGLIQEGARHSHFEGFGLIGGGGAAATGFETRTAVSLRDIRIYNFSGRGFDINASADVSDVSSDYGDASQSVFDKCHAIQCGSHGFHVRGRDASAVKLDTCNAVENGGWGFWDQSSYGGQFVNCHAAGNALGSFKAIQVIGSIAFVGCYVEGGTGQTCDIAANHSILGGTLSGTTNAATSGGLPSSQNGLLTKANSLVLHSNQDQPGPLNDKAYVFRHATHGLWLQGAGAFYDLVIRNQSDLDVLRVPTLTQNVELAGDLNLTTAGKAIKVNGTQVVGARGAAVADATDAASAITQLNALLARCRAHGLIA